MDHVHYTKDYDISFVCSNCNYRVKFTVALCLNKETKQQQQKKTNKNIGRENDKIIKPAQCRFYS